MTLIPPVAAFSPDNVTLTGATVLQPGAARPLRIHTEGTPGNYTPANGEILWEDAASAEMLRVWAGDPAEMNYNAWNLYFGLEAGKNQPTDNVSAGYFNQGFGAKSLYSISTGFINAAFGIYALNSLTTGDNNTACGHFTLFAATTPSKNTAVGSRALVQVTTGANNTAIGAFTGLGITTGSNNTILGANVGGLAAGLTGNVILADGAGNKRAHYDGTKWVIPAGAVVQVKTSNTAACTTGTTLIPFDDTIPQNTEGDEYLTCAITPANAANILHIRAILHASVSVADVIHMALFRDATANALAVSSFWEPTDTGNVPLVLDFYVVAGSTAATTFKLRAGPTTALRTLTVNGVSGARKFGGVLVSQLVITEVTP